MSYLRIFLACSVLGLGILALHDGDVVVGVPLFLLGLLLVDRWVR